MEQQQQYSGGSWMMVPGAPTPNTTTPLPANPQDHFLHQQQQQQIYQQQQQQQQRHHLHQLQQQQQQQQQNHHHQSLASHFHLLNLVENLADVIENGSRDQHSELLISELTSNFDKCQQLLNSISGSISSKSMQTVEGQKRKLEESEQLLNQRRDLIAKYRNSVEELINSDR